MRRRTDQEVREMHAQALQSMIVPAPLVTPLLEELLELRAWVRANGWSNLKDPRMPKMGDP
jgi:hypothetical protein